MIPSYRIDPAVREPLIAAAVSWSRDCVAKLEPGSLPLDESGLRLAARAGVRHPERVRVVMVNEVPLPDSADLAPHMAAVGLGGGTTAGLTLGHLIILRRTGSTDDVLLHELRHVRQAEVAGSIELFIREYVTQLLDFGYQDAPWEVEARGEIAKPGPLRLILREK